MENVSRLHRIKVLQRLGVIILMVSVAGCSLFENEQKLHLCEEVYLVAEQMPLLIGGMSELQGKVEYPAEAKDAGIEGRVTVQFVVDKLGKVRDAEVIRGIGGGADEEALRVINQARFESGEQSGEPVCVEYALPINFRLEN